MKWAIKYFPLVVLLIVWCFTAPAKTKAAKPSSNLDDILSEASRIRPGMLTDKQDSFADSDEKDETRTLLKETHSSYLSKNSATARESRKLRHLAMMMFSSIFLLYYK